MRALLILLLALTPIAPAHPQVAYSFEDGSLAGWAQSPESSWAASPGTPIGGSRSLRHNASGEGSHAVSIALPGWDGTQGTVVWRFRLRHGHHPSTANRWAVFLTAASGAAGMLPGQPANGYAVGVNLTGSDDTLRLYRVSNGVFTSILSSALHWEAAVGTSGVAAIEVERRPNGRFTLRSAASGQFAQLEPQGAVVDTHHPFGGFFGIRFTFTSSAAGRLWVDDISLAYQPINPNNHDALVVAPAVPIPSGVIASQAQSAGQAVPVLRFTIRDQGTSDGLPTAVTRLRFVRAPSVGPASWRSAIGGVTLASAQGVPIPIASTYIMPDAIELAILPNQLLVPNGQSAHFTLSLFLGPGPLVDGSTIRLGVGAVSDGWEAHHGGTEFALAFPEAFDSNPFTVQVAPTHLFFSAQPQRVVVNGSFAVAAVAGDALGNPSATFAGPVALSLAQGVGMLTVAGGGTVTAVAGVATWPMAAYSGRDPFVLTAASDGLTPAAGRAIQVINDTSSLIVAPAHPVAPGPISSLANSPGLAVDAMRFTLSDAGANDGVPTHVRQMVLVRPAGEMLASFSQNIAGVVLLANGQPIPIGPVAILTASLTISLPRDALVIPDGASVEVTLRVFLRSGGLEDGRALIFSIPSANHGFTADAVGSGFARALPQPVVSSPMEVDVRATRLRFESVPQVVGLGQPFAVGVAAVDAGGSIDGSASGGVTLSKAAGTGWLTVPAPEQPLVNGRATWSGLMYFAPEPFTLLAGSGGLGHAVSPAIFCADATSQALSPLDSLPSATISSLRADASQAVEAFRLRLADPGTTDGLPTHVEQLVLHAFGHPQAQPLHQVIAGVMLSANGQPVAPASIAIDEKAITLTLAQGQLVIANADTLNISVAIYLQRGGLAHGAALQLYIPATGHGLKAYPVGSRFATALDAWVLGPRLRIEVRATTLAFVQEPLAASPSAPFTLRAAATDAHGNVDTGASGAVTLSLEYGPKVFVAQARTVGLTHGVAQWNQVQVGGVGVYRFRAAMSDNPSRFALSGEVWCGFSPSCPIDVDFEGGYPLTLPYSPAWDASPASPIEGARSLRHALSNVAGESSLPIPIGLGSMGLGSLGWEFALRNGAWVPSSSNAFWFVLASDAPSITRGQFNGYAVGVNLTGSCGRLTLWRVTRDATPTPIIQTDFAWGASETVGIRVTRSPRGTWTLWVQPRYGESIPLVMGTARDNTHTQLIAFGPAFKFTSTRAGALWIDNIRLCSTPFPPVIVSARMRSLSSVEVVFNQPLDPLEALKPQHYSLRTLGGERIAVEQAFHGPGSPGQVTLRTARLPLETLMLRVSGVTNTQGLACNDSITLGMGGEGAMGSVVINELMVRPTPVVGLPDAEYIELYNRTSQPIEMRGWWLRANEKYLSIPTVTLPAHGHLLLCGSGAAPRLSPFGQTVAVPSFPSLLNAGMLIGIYNAQAQVVSWAEYTQAWYADPERDHGGYSLERIDPDNLAQGPGNWRASADRAGGTPGRANSVRAHNPDRSPPTVVEVRAIDDRRVEVGFSEPMDSLSITLHSHYTLSGGIGHPRWVTSAGPRYNRATLELADPLQPHAIYSICFHGAIRDFAGNPLAGDCLPLALPATPARGDIVINEVLFNPFAGGTDFVELYNRSALAFDLSRLWIATRDARTLAIRDYYRASDTARLLLPNQLAVLTASPPLVSRFYPVPNPRAMIWTSRMPSFPNRSGYVVILEEHGDVVDELAYSEDMHFPLLGEVKGVSLERIHPDLPTGSPSSWQSAAQAAGFATPTGLNSQHQGLAPGAEGFTLSGGVFSPDGDGHEDLLLIGYQLPREGYMANVQVFDARGRMVRRLAANMLLGTSGVLKWDGLTDAGHRAPVGVYVVFVEAFHLGGQVRRYKLTCAVATRFR